MRDFGLEVGGDGEGEANIHCRLSRIHGVSNEFIDLGEGDDFVNLRAISARFMPRIEPLRKMFSRPVSSR